MKNTEISLMYRDADNYKAFETVVVKGEITEKLVKQIKSGLEDGEYVICDQIGLPSPSVQFIGFDGFPNEDIDHVWTEFTDMSDLKQILTDSEPTIDLTIDQLANRISEVEWDVEKEMMRMQSLA